MTISIGIAAFPDDARDPIQLVEQADAALYAAKRTARKSCVPIPPERSRRRCSIETAPFHKSMLTEFRNKNRIFGFLERVSGHKAEFFSDARQFH
jgi:GGDEF domain-containing protein